MSSSSTVVPVLEIGGTHVTAALVDARAGAVVPGTVRRDGLDAAADAESILGAILACAGSVDAAAGAPWGVAVPGPFDYAQG
ncbi:MAG: ROK family protein, partial [Catenulispora sp.]|nr:ROK family protein [Catenulispora sp.]